MIGFMKQKTKENYRAVYLEFKKHLEAVNKNISHGNFNYKFLIRYNNTTIRLFEVLLLYSH